MATLAGVQRSFAHAERLLADLCGWDLDAESVRRITHRTARRAGAGRPGRADRARFAAAPGDPEVAVDAGKVNTRGGWRDVKVAVISRREPGEPAVPADWDTRTLPPPTVRTVVAAVEDTDRFADRVRAETDRLNVTASPAATVLADGGEWIWNLAAMVLPLASGVLDVYHALEHVAAAAKAVWGDTPEAERHRTEAAAVLLAEGKVGIERWIGAAVAAVPAGGSADPLVGLAAYLANHPGHLDYAGRLAAGRSIGSGQVEGAIKELVNLRLKRTGARWRADHVGPLVELLALTAAPEWHDLWTAA